MSAAVPKPSPSGAHKPFTFTSPRLIQQYQMKWYPKIIWFFVGGAIALLTLANIAYILRVRARRRALAKTISSPNGRGESVRPGSGTRPALRNVPRAIGALFKIVAFRWTLPYGLNYVISLSELSISCAYLGILLTWGFIKSKDLTPAYWNQRVASIAWWQLPLLPLLSGKNNLIGYVTGIGHEKINIIHRAVARSIFILVLCHTFNKLKGFPVENLEMKKYKSGLMAVVAFASIFLCSLRPIRTHAFEFFLILHVCLICITIAGAYFHQPEDALALWLLIGFWLFDRLVRLFRMLSINQGKPKCTDAIVEVITPKAVRLTLPNRDIKWKAGQHVYLTIPGVSTIPFEAHPFTIANIPSGQGHSDLVFFIRAMDGFTRKLDEYAQSHDGQSVTAVVDGPYGVPPPVNTFSTVVLIAGGSGVSFTLPLLLDVVAAARRKQSPVKRVVFIWSLRSPAEVKWASEALNDIHNNPPSGLSVDIRVHITRASSLVPSLENADTEKTESAIDSPASEKNSSSDNIKGEKGEKGPRTIITETLADEAISHDGHSPNTIGTFKTELGRCAVEALIQEEIEASFGPVLVTGSGPIPLTKAVRSALRKGAAGPLAVLRGGQPVTMYIENFGALRS